MKNLKSIKYHLEIPVFKYGLWFRMVEETDAAFILSLRTDARLARYLSQTENDVARQQEWIRAYKVRELKGLEYYFIFEDHNHEPQGVVRLYDFKGKTYNSGSWLVKPGSDDFTAIKSDLFISSFALDELGFEQCLFDVRKANKKVVRFHKMFATVTGEDENNLYLTMDRKAYERKYHYLKNIIEPEI